MLIGITTLSLVTILALFKTRTNKQTMLTIGIWLTTILYHSQVI